LSLCFSILRSAEVGKANPVLRVAQRRIMVYEGKRAGSRGKSSTPILSRRSLSLITHVNTTLQPSKSWRCSWRFTVWQFYWPMSIGFRNHVVPRDLCEDTDYCAGINIKWISGISFFPYSWLCKRCDWENKNDIKY
jgi:hypothetical protein